MSEFLKRVQEMDFEAAVQTLNHSGTADRSELTEALRIALENRDYSISYWLMAHKKTSYKRIGRKNLSKQALDVLDDNISTMRQEGLIE